MDATIDTPQALDRPRVLSDIEVNAFLNVLFDGEKSNDESPSSVDKAIELDPELRRLNREAETELLVARSEWRRALDEKMLSQSIGSRVHAEINGEVEGAGFWYARGYRYLFSPEFQAAWNSKSYGRIVADLVTELGIGAGIDQLRDSLKSGLDRLMAGLESTNARCAIPVILLFLMMYVTLPRGSRSWSGIPMNLLMASLKTAVFYYTSVWVGIPLMFMVDHYNEARQDLSNAGYEGRIWLAALKSALKSSFVGTVHRSVLGGGGVGEMNFDPAVLHPDCFCHESFTDVFGDLEVMSDPVFLHGFQMEREFATTIVRQGLPHPITRKRILLAHILEPTPEYKRLHQEYIRQRDAVIRDHVF